MIKLNTLRKYLEYDGYETNKKRSSSNRHDMLKMNYRCNDLDWMNGANDLTDEVIQIAHQVQKETKNYNISNSS